MNKQEISPNKLYQILHQKFGYTNFREGQEEIIESVLAGKDTVVIKSTGGGKSLCYQLPSLLQKGITVVISPLISLMEDQVHEARKMGRKDVASLHSGLSSTDRKLILHKLKEYSLLYISPEGIQNEWIISALKRRGVSLFVVDEAHCISQWGHDFRTDYLKLASVREMLGNPSCLALTATATEEVRQDMLRYLHLAHPSLFQFSVDRQNIAIKVERVDSEVEKMERIIDFVKKRKDAGMIYFSSRAKAEELTELLMEHGVDKVAYYHGGMSTEERHLIQQQFLDSELRLICATNAFGMGINKANIRYVIHYHFPSHIEGYVQEMGRCSRDGQPGLSYVFTQDGDEQIPYHFIEQEFLDKDKIEKLVTYILYKQKQGEICTLEEIAILLHTNEQAVQFVLFHLEQLDICQYMNKSEILFLKAVSPSVLDTLHQRIETQRKKRLKKIADMYYWLKLQASHCRRDYLLHYFSEKMTNQPESCCDLCGLEPIFVMRDLDAHPAQNSKVRFLHNESWLDKLEKLWPVKVR